MFITDKAFAYRNFISHASLTSKVAAGIVIWAALIVATGAVSRPEQALNSVDKKDIKLMSTRQVNGAASRLLFLETDPAWYAASSRNEAVAGNSLNAGRDVEASMVNGHIQAF